MYNQQIKEEYLSKTTESIRYILTNIFKKSEVYEEQKGKDICDFIENEILEFLSDFSSSSINTVASNASLLRSYTQWCCDNNINTDHINHFDMVSIDMLNTCINPFVNKEKHITIEEVYKLVDNVVNICDKALILSLFYGINGKDCVELTNITLDDIDRFNHKIKLVSGRTVYAPADLCNLLSQSCSTYDYILCSGKKFDTLTLDQSDTSPFKRRSNARFSTQEKARLRIVARLTKLREELNTVAVTMDRLKNSGIIHYMKKAIEENPELNKDNIYNSCQMKEIQKQYNIESVKPFTLKARYKDFL